MSQKINYNFVNPELLKKALTHRSFSSEGSNERLEFLGDAVLEMVVTEYIYTHYPDLQEGELAKMRAEVVCSASLEKVADALSLSQDLVLGKSEKSDGIRPRSSILANAVEAIVAAIYLDGGLEAVEPLILDWFKEAIEEAGVNPGMADYKTRLQELAARQFGGIPEYEISSQGPDHEKFFYAKVRVAGENFGEGTGKTKKEASQNAAMQACELLHKNESAQKVEK